MIKQVVLKTTFFLLMCCVFSMSKAQTTRAWFNQKQTKLKYIEQQIAAFEMYAGYLKKGYDIAQKGWKEINDIKQGDFQLHAGYFDSLKIVNNLIADDSAVGKLLVLQSQIRQVCASLNQFSITSVDLNAGEKNYINRVVKEITLHAGGDNKTLEILVTNGAVAMSDDERVKKINELYESIIDVYDFIVAFQNDVQILVLSRLREYNDVQTIKSLNNIKK